MGYVEDKEKTGGMIGGIGYLHQDCASIKFMFDYLENGLEEISFETLDDFYLVLKEERISVQAKINCLDVKYVRKLSKKYKPQDIQYFVGSSISDDIRTVIQYKNRYMEAISGKTNLNKNELYNEFKECCQKRDLDSEFILKCNFSSLEDNKVALAKQSINEWAAKKKIYINASELFDTLYSKINFLRTIGGHLSRTDIYEIINKHRESRIESFIPKQDRMSSIFEDEQKRNLEEYFNDLIIRYPDVLSNELNLIKALLVNEQLVEAKNRMNKVAISCPEIRQVWFMVLNILGEHERVIREAENGSVWQNEEKIEIARAYTCINNSVAAINMLREIEEKNWTFFEFYLYAINSKKMGENDVAIEYIKKCIQNNPKFVDGLIFGASLIYMTDVDLAVEYIDLALEIDEKYPNAYRLRAEISKLFDDYYSVIDNYEKYMLYSSDYDNCDILIEIACNKYLGEFEDWQEAFCMWNETFRKSKLLTEEVNIGVINIGMERVDMFRIMSGVNRLSIFHNNEEIFAYESGQGLSRAGISIFCRGFEYQRRKMIAESSKNPINKGERTIVRDSAHPAIYKFYDDIETYNNTIERLKNTGKIHFNKHYGEQLVEYISGINEIQTDLVVKNGTLKGNVKIGEINLIVDIPELKEGFAQFRKQYDNEMINEAAIVLYFDEHTQTLILFPKTAVELTVY